MKCFEKEALENTNQLQKNKFFYNVFKRIERIWVFNKKPDRKKVKKVLEELFVCYKTYNNVLISIYVY